MKGVPAVAGSLKAETVIGEFDAGDRLFMKNKFVFRELWKFNFLWKSAFRCHSCNDN